MIPNGNKLRGPPKTTSPIAFNKDFTLIRHPIRPHPIKDLAQEISKLAQDRKCWSGLALQVEEAAEVSQTKNWDAIRQ